MNTDIPIIRTKVIIPRKRSDYISRTRLIRILDDILDLKLLIVAAPAGYGKTSLLVDFSSQTQLPVCWFALDPLDCDPQRFIAHFIASLHHCFPTFGAQAISALNDFSQDTLNIEPVVSAVVNDAYEHISEHFVLILDDYHLVRDSKPVENFLNRVIQDLAENSHIIIASRTLLTLPDLSLLVARSQVGGLSFEELAFQPEEIKQLLSANYKQEINDQRTQELLELTEGWITGLLLSAQLTHKGVEERMRVARVSGIGIYEYLAQQVFDRQPEEVKDFLLRTSLLEEFDAEMCVSTLSEVEKRQREEWQALIDRILHDNLFVLPVGEDTLFLRYHHLFRDFLQNRIRTERPHETEIIEKKLAKNLEESREWERAYAIYARFGDTQSKAGLIHRAGPEMVAAGRLVTLSGWFADLTEEMVKAHPELLSIKGSIALIRGETQKSLELLNEAVDGLRGSELLSDLTYSLIRRSTVLRQSGRYEDALKDAEEAVMLADGRAKMEIQKAEALRSRGIIFLWQGHLQQSLLSLKNSFEIYQHEEKTMDTARVLLDLGLVYRRSGLYEETVKSYNQALTILQSTGNAMLSANILNNLGVLQQMLGNFGEAAASLDRALQYARLAVYPRMEGYTLNSIGDLYRDLGAFEQARFAYDQVWTINTNAIDQTLEMYQYISLASLDRLEGNIPSAHSLLEQAAGKARSGYEQSLCELEMAVLILAEKQYSQSAALLDRLINHFQAEGHQGEVNRARFLLFLTQLGSGEYENAEKSAAILFSSTLAPASQYAVMHLVKEFSGILQQHNEKIHSIPGLNQVMQSCERLQQQIPEIRRELRRRSPMMPHQQAQILIRSLGRLQIKVAGKSLSITDWKTQSSRDFFLYMLSHNEGVTKDEIAEVFWPEATAEASRLRFKNTIYRVRKAVGTDCISYIDDFYRFNRSIDYEYDVEEFNREISIAAQCTSPADQIMHYKAAVSLYHGPLLPKLDMEWVLIQRAQLHQTFLESVLKLSNLYLQTGQYKAAIQTAARALVEDPCQEAAYRLIMLANSSLGSRAEIAREYDKCKQTLLTELNVEPSQQTRALFETLMR